MYLLWKTGEKDGLLGQSILKTRGTAAAVLFLAMKASLYSMRGRENDRDQNNHAGGGEGDH